MPRVGVVLWIWAGLLQLLYIVQKLHDRTLPSLFSCVAVMEDLYNYVQPLTKTRSPMISKETYEVVMKNAEVCCVWFYA